MSRDFNEWLSKFKRSISGYGYYIDFEKVFENVESIKIELNILNSLIGSKNIESDFEKILTEYPKTLKCIPILLAVRTSEIFATDAGKNRGGHQMEDLVEKHLVDSGVKEYYKEMTVSEIQAKWGVDLSAISNTGKSEKRFDFVVKTKSMIYGIETNFYTGGGSKLNETARSYKMLSQEADTIDGFTFVWFTDGYVGWKSARHNLEETFDVMEHIYSIDDMENGIMKKIFK